jgi:hypothetical protein
VAGVSVLHSAVNYSLIWTPKVALCTPDTLAMALEPFIS